MGKKTRKILSDLLVGMGLPSEVYVEKKYKRARRNSVAAMRSDWERIGMDFRAVIRRENGKASSEKRVTAR